jgi:beta-carotene ketolase (CrtW type)
MSVRPTYRWKGILIALTVITAWAASLAISLTSSFILSPSLPLPYLLTPVFVLLNTFLYTGLFITAHDAMHGTVAPAHPALNRAIGRVCTRLYALFGFDAMLKKHHEHHRHPASDGDPDFHDGRHTGFARWYAHFFFTYVTWKQLVGMAVIYNLLKYAAGIPDVNILLFWVLPALASTLQLFFFGTYLPHREPAEGYIEPHRAVSNAYGVALSFLTCYHFGYHLEHHEKPGVPWWGLPKEREGIGDRG